MDKVVRVEHTIRASTNGQAKRIFSLACTRLLQVRDWSRLADSLLFESEHRDCHGAPVSRPAKEDDYINLTKEDQRPFGWMQVIAVTETTSAYADEVVLISRPVGLPFEAADDTNAKAGPATLKIVRSGMDVTAAFFVEAHPVLTVFNTLGVYLVQWRSLVTGLLGDLTSCEIVVDAEGSEAQVVS